MQMQVIYNVHLVEPLPDEYQIRQQDGHTYSVNALYCKERPSMASL